MYHDEDCERKQDPNDSCLCDYRADFREDVRASYIFQGINDFLRLRKDEYDPNRLDRP